MESFRKRWPSDSNVLLPSPGHWLDSRRVKQMGKTTHHHLGVQRITSERRRHAPHRTGRWRQGLPSYKASSPQQFAIKPNSPKRRVQTAGYTRAFFTHWLNCNGLFPVISVINRLHFHFHPQRVRHNWATFTLTHFKSMKGHGSPKGDTITFHTCASSQS